MELMDESPAAGPTERQSAVNVDDVVAEKIAAARARIEREKRRRAALAAARKRGLAIRHAAKLREANYRRTYPQKETP